MNHPKIKTPNCNKLARVHDIKLELESFLDFLNQRGIHLATYNKYDQLYIGSGLTREELFAKYFGYNLKKLEAERRQILESLQKERRQ